MQSDNYFKKRLTYSYKKHQFLFDVGHTIFSAFQIDEGTQLLLRTLESAAEALVPQQILDLGCGCGVLGISLAHSFPKAHVTLIDKDLLAVRYAKQNCLLNATLNTEVCASIGLEAAPSGPFELIVSNIPAKIGDLAIEQEFILAPYARLRPGGAFWFVVVSSLNHLIPNIGTKWQLKLKAIKKRAGHTVYRLSKPLESS